MEVSVQGVVSPPPDVLDGFQTLLGYAAGIVFLLCVAKVIFVGARLAWDHKHGAGLESPTAAEFLAANIGAILAGGVAATLATILLATAQGPQAHQLGGGHSPTVIDQLEQLQQQQQQPDNEENER
ncbi:hypothetical protein NQ854_24685 [Rhodococcus ruber]|uniref:hypothetical protein n=1 Tax=Rhodococcus TaxID=1827 RepID=UPI000C9B1812|nr:MULTISPECIES: hypothetical protein [Rhodococcus]PND53983.1 hypothetical protein CQZ88_00290 [Rhodococcus sp. ENV425]QRI79267.1 hypothetical protein JQ505_28120 [Rhodococcus aetherivorans]QSE62452.1 hypothetical protein JYA75_28625 [Rhodococcus sp. PSBB066]